MHKYMRAIGFSKFNNFKEEQKLITDIIVNASKRAYTSLSDDIIISSFSKEFAPGVGITVVGQFDEDDQFTYSYYYPYVESLCISSEEDISVDRHAATDSYAGVIDDVRTGVSIIFYLQNMIPYINAVRTNMLPMTGTTLSLSALSDTGTILMPLKKTVKDVVTNQQILKSRSMLINAARSGDDEAMENLTLKDMDTYTTIAQRIQTDDVFTLVDTYFMPYGIECDNYAILGEITEVTELRNSVSSEEMYKLSLVCNDIEMTICVNKKDVYGQPEVGRRYKGTIWLQGHINYPMSS
ncbi:MAG: DUF3881 family protein [Lachnospiraceae bacterium]|nr:DUF3881 family protein [Lachnospiraceae bacterium]